MFVFWNGWIKLANKHYLKHLFPIFIFLGEVFETGFWYTTHGNLELVVLPHQTPKFPSIGTESILHKTHLVYHFLIQMASSFLSVCVYVCMPLSNKTTRNSISANNPITLTPIRLHEEQITKKTTYEFLCLINSLTDSQSRHCKGH